ncbi:conserved hypothetical protein [Ricinus communis]|uniref:Uncharacterized protein n=1 Tax=Ricinus communis TaxID=3988 RepID=B9REN0_RICCO|nr:conserved hypothetical protein [Ricinus communis]
MMKRLFHLPQLVMILGLSWKVVTIGLVYESYEQDLSAQASSDNIKACILRIYWPS